MPTRTRVPGTRTTFGESIATVLTVFFTPNVPYIHVQSGRIAHPLGRPEPGFSKALSQPFLGLWSRFGDKLIRILLISAHNGTVVCAK